MGRKRKPVPQRKLGPLDILAAQTETQPSEWVHITRGTIMHRKGYRYYHAGKNLYAALPKDEQT